MPPALGIQTEKRANADILRLTGRLDSATSQELEALIRKMAGAGSSRIVLNLDGTEYVSSSGLRVLLVWLRRLRKMQGDLKIACIRPRIREVLFLAGFNRIFYLYDTEEAALESFSFGVVDEHEERVLDIVATTLDMEEDLKKTKESLHQSETLYRTIFERTGTAMAIVEEDLTIDLVNTEFEKMTGYSCGELCGKITLLPFVVRDDLAMVTEFHDLVRRESDISPRHYEFRLKDRAGTIRFMYVILDMIPDTTRRIYSLHDITELRKIEEDLRHELTRKREFIILAAHELRTPLQPVMGYLHMVLEDPETYGVSPALRDILAKCSAQVDHVRGIIEHTVKMNDLAFGPEQMLPRFKPQYRETIPRNLLGSYISVLHVSGDVRIAVEIPGDLKLVTDSEYFFLILQSLIFNSIRYSPVPADITISAQGDEQQIRFMIRNRNAVIAEEIIQDIFRPFTVTHESRLLEKFGFIGISLPVAKKMAELLGGDIALACEPGEGCTFTLTLPKIPAPE